MYNRQPDTNYGLRMKSKIYYQSHTLDTEWYSSVITISVMLLNMQKYQSISTIESKEYKVSAIQLNTNTNTDTNLYRIQHTNVNCMIFNLLFR